MVKLSQQAWQQAQDLSLSVADILEALKDVYAEVPDGENRRLYATLRGKDLRFTVTDMVGGGLFVIGIYAD